MGAFNQLNGAIFDAAAIEARISAVDGKSIYNQRDGATLSMDSLARRLTALDGKVAVGQGGIEFDVDSFMRRLAAIEAGAFTPLSLSNLVSWYDPSDFSSMFQDSAGTTPVTALGQPVGKILDKSGRGNHKIQSTTSNRPVITQDAGGYFYLALNGTNSCMQSATNVDFTPYNKLTVCMGVNKSTESSGSMLVELSSSSATTAGAFGLDGNGFSSPGSWLGASAGGTPGGSQIIVDGAIGTFVAPVSAVSTLSIDLTQTTKYTQIGFRVNGVPVAQKTTDGAATAAGNFRSDTLYFGARAGASLFFTGRFYQTVIRGDVGTALELANLERYVGAKQGITL